MIRLPLLHLAAIGTAAAASAQMPSCADDVEPHVRAAVVAAWERTPLPWRERLAGLRVVRAPALRAAADAPLATRLQAAGALAWYAPVGRTLTVSDAGANGGGARWRDGDVAPAAVAAFLRELGPLAAADDRAPTWPAFVAAVWSWRDEAAPTPTPPVGAAMVFDRFVGGAPARLLGGEPPLDALLFHEFAHAIQLQADNPMRRVAAWSGWSDWRNTDDGGRADGFLAGASTPEDAIVLARLALGAPRGGGRYTPHATAAFPSAYAAFDPREDFAECARLLAYAPTALAQRAPIKLLALDALGWTARLDDADPGPRWLADAELATPSLRAAVVAGARALLAEDGPGAAAEPFAAVAVLRAHADLLATADLPPAVPPLAPPDDLPAEARDAVSASALTFVVAGVPRTLPPARVRAAWDDAYAAWRRRDAFAAGLRALRDEPAPAPVEPVERAAAAVDAALARGDRAAALLLTLAIPGGTHGAALRVERLLAIAAIAPADGLAAPARRAAAADADAVTLPGLRAALRQLVGADDGGLRGR